MKRIIAAVAVTLAVPASADTLGPYTDLLVFGDSLSDSGNVSIVTDSSIPFFPVYPNGQYTNGDTWATQLGTAASLSPEGGTNFAYGNATAVQTVEPDAFFDVPDFVDQRALYGASGVELGDNPLTAIWFGGNDLRTLISSPPAPENAEAVVGALIFSVVTAITTGINELAATGLDDFLVFGLPDLGKIPAVVNDPVASFQATELTTNFNLFLAGALTAYEDTGIDVSFFDTQSFFNALLGDADTLGITNVTDACVVADDIATPDVDETLFCGAEQGSYAFFDGLHPTEKVHTALAGAVRDFVTPVPLPGGLTLALGGLVLLGSVARRRKVAVA